MLNLQARAEGCRTASFCFALLNLPQQFRDPKSVGLRCVFADPKPHFRSDDRGIERCLSLR
jgi:hypothetical protein